MVQKTTKSHIIGILSLSSYFLSHRKTKPILSEKIHSIKPKNYLTASFKAFPAVNLGTVIAGILILALV